MHLEAKRIDQLLPRLIEEMEFWGGSSIGQLNFFIEEERTWWEKSVRARLVLIDFVEFVLHSFEANKRQDIPVR